MRSLNMIPFVLAGVLAIGLPAAAGAQHRPPNVVLILIDDMGWKDTGYAGSDLHETPNVDRLAREGMVFTDAYAAAANCAPSRASLLSGQYTPRHGVYGVGSTLRGPVDRMRLVPVPNTAALAAEKVTIAEAMKQAGYRTGMFGKWHVGTRSPWLPEDQGFDVVDAMTPPGAEEFATSGDPKWVYRITDGAVRFIEENRDRPFFLYVSHHATHMEIQARPETRDAFRRKGPGRLHRNTDFAAMNREMDNSVGIILSRLDELGLRENTVVVFTSDNGALPQSPPVPLRGFKGMYYEGGIRVPMIVRWPGVVAAGTTSAVPVINVDLYPTVLELAGAPASRSLDGETLVPLFRGASALRRQSIYWHFPGYLGQSQYPAEPGKLDPGSRDEDFRSRPVSVVRRGDWKLLLYHEEWTLDGGRDALDESDAVELYDLRLDPGETRNQANSHPAKRDELLDDLLAWMRATSATPALERNPAYDARRASVSHRSQWRAAR